MPFSASQLSLLGKLGSSDSAAPSEAAPSAAGAPAINLDSIKVAPSSSIAATPGFSPDSATDDSPLSIAQRAVLGWVRTPEEQVKYLKQHFDDATFVQNGPSSGHIAVNDKGTWKQADPDFGWSVSADSAKKAAGDVAQFAGEYGLRTLGATAGAAIALAAAPAIAATGLGALGLGVLGAGVGAGASEGVDLASRAALSPQDSPGAQPYKDAAAVRQQLALSTIYGMSQEVGGKLIGKALGKAADVLGNIIDTVAGEGPAGRAAVKKVFGLMDIKDAEIDARLNNPSRQAFYDNVAAEDTGRSIAQKKLPDIQDNVFHNELMPQVTSIVKREQGEFAALKADPRMKSVEIDVSQPLLDAIDTFKKEGYVKPNGVINKERVLFDGDVEAMNRIMSRQTMSKGLSYDDARMLSQDMGALLDKGGLNNTVYAQVAKFKNAIHQSIIDALPDDLATRYGDVMQKYGPAKDLLSEMNKIGDKAQKKISFMSRLTGDNRNAAQDMVRSLVDAGVKEDTIDKLIQTEGAKNAQSWFSKSKKVLGVPMPLGGRPASMMLNAGSAVGDAAGQTADAIPYLDQAFKTLRNVSCESRAYILKNPQAIDTIVKSTAGAAMSEQQQKQQLVQQATGGGQ